MSRVEEGNLFFKRFTRVALALSAVTSSFVLAGNVDISGTVSEHMLDGDITKDINATKLSAVAAAADDITVTGATDIRGAIKAGKATTSGTPAVTTVQSGTDTEGKVTGVNVNIAIDSFTNLGSVIVKGDTLDAYTNSGVTYYPAEDNTSITATAVLVDEDIVHLFSNSGVIGATATLRHDTNASDATANAVLIAAGKAINEGFTNTRTGFITATATKASIGETPQAQTGGYEGQSQVGGSTGKATVNKDDDDIDTTVVTARTHSAGGNDNENELSAAGVRVEGTITGGLSNHGYISSVVNEATGTIIGSTTEGSTYKENGLTVTPNISAGAGAADDSGVDTTGTEPTDADIAAMEADADANIKTALHNSGTQNVNATDNNGSLSYEYADGNAAPDDGNGDLEDGNPYGDNLQAEIDSQLDAAYTAQDETIHPTGDVQGAIDGAKENIRAAYLLAPEGDTISDEITDQQGSVDSPPDAATPGAKAEGIKSGGFTARIGDVHNYGAITGVAGGNGVEVRATTSSNVSDLLTATDDNLTLTHTVDANGAINGNNNAGVTSGAASAYLGEGTSPIVILQSATGDVTNNLVGGLFNGGTITGGAGKAGISLNSDSSVDVNKDADNSDNLALSVSHPSLTINVDPSSNVGVGQLYNYKDKTITGGSGASGIEMLAGGSSAVMAHNDKNITGGILRVTPITLNSVGILGNAGTIEGTAGASGITMSATSEAKIDTGAGSIQSTADIKVTPLVTNRIDTLVNINTIKGGMGGSGIAGSATATATIKSKDINESSTIEVAPIVNSTVGDLYNYGADANIKASLGINAVALTSTGTAELITDKVEHATVAIHSQSTGGVRIKGNTDSTGSFHNGGEMSVALSADAVTLDATGTAKIATSTGGASKDDTEFIISGITVKDTTIAGTEGDFFNIYQDDNGTHKENHRGTIKASLAADALTAEATGETKLLVKSIDRSTVHFEQNTRSGIGGKFVNGGDIKVALAANAVDLSSTSTTTAYDKDSTDINASTVTTITETRAGTGGDFVNGAFALETGDKESNTSWVYNPATRPTGSVIAAMVSSLDNDRNSSGETENNATGAGRLVKSTPIDSYDREDTITTATIKAALAADAVKFESIGTGDLKAKNIVAGITRYSDGTDTFDTMQTTSVVRSYTESNSSIGGDFINNGEISVALAANGVNGASTGTGTLGDAAASSVRSSTAIQVTVADGGVKGDFKNEVVSSDVGNAMFATELSGNLESAKLYYNRATNLADNAKITSALAADAIKLTADSTNNLTLLASDAAKAAVAGSSANPVYVGHRLAAAQATLSTIESSTYTISGIEKDFSNTGLISVALAASGLDATATGTNNIGDIAHTNIGGSTVTANMKSIAGVRGDFTNDIHALDTGDAELLHMDVKNHDGTPRYYIHEDGKEGERVKSNVLDTNAIVIGDNGKEIDTDGIVYDKELAKGEITAALAKNPIKLDGEATVNFAPISLGVTAVDTVILVAGSSPATVVVDSDLAVQTTSSLISDNKVIAGIGGRFTNKNLISTALAAEALTATGTATNNFGIPATTVVEGANVDVDTVTISGIGNLGDNNGFVNLSNTYDTGDIQTDTSFINSGTNNTGTLIKATANTDVVAGIDELPLIESATVAFWNKAKVIGTMSSALAKEVVKVEGTASSTLAPKEIKSASTNVTLSDGSTTDVEDYLVTGNSKVDVDVTTTTYAGIKGGFTNQGAMTSALAKQVLNAKGTAEGTIGDSGNSDIIGAELVKNSTTVVAGIQGGGFKNEAISLDVINGDVGTSMSGGVESPTLYFDKVTTKEDTVMSSSLAKEVLLLDATATNVIDTKSIVAFEAVQDTTADNQTDANGAKSTVVAITAATGGIAGDFYNNAKLDAALSSHVITSVATSDNDLGVAGKPILGSTVTATSSSDTQIKGAFINDTVLLDTGAATETYRLTAAGDDSNVIESITYEQEINEGKIKAALSKDVLRLIAEGTNNIKLSEVGNSEVKVVARNQTSGYIGDAATFTEHNVSSAITANNTAKSGIGGSFVNAGTMESSLSKVVLNFQAIGGASTVEIDKISGGTVDATNTVISGVNLNNSATNTIAFLNDKRDFNTVLETDATYDTDKVITGTIKSGLGKEVVNLVAEGGVKTDITPDAAGMETADGVDTPFEIAKINNTGDNSVIINGHFVNKGTIEAATAPHALILSSTNSVINDIDAGIVTDGIGGNKDGMVSSIAMADVNTSINGTLDNSGLIKTATGTSVISLISDGGSSTIVSTASDVAGIEYASTNNIEIAKNISTTESSIGGLRNTGTIDGSAGAKAIVLDADGIADSITGLATLPDTTATNAVFVNQLTSTAKIGNIYNSGSIKTADATVIDLTANGGAKMIATTVAQENIEDTSAMVVASIGDINNDAYTEQNVRRDVDKFFNGGHQLLPNEGNVTANRGEYDFASFGTTDTNGNTNYGATVGSPTQHDAYNYSSGTKIVSDETAYSLEANLTALAYEDGNASKNPALSQTIGEIKTGTGPAAISLVSVATDSNHTTVKATAGNILNRGLINGGTGKGIFLSSTGVLQASGDNTTGAKAYATTGYIHNQVTDNTFTGENGVILHTVIEGKIKGDAGAIVLVAAVGDPAVDQEKQDVSITTVDTIVNNRLVLDKGATVISSDDGGTADGKVKNSASDFATVTSIALNYGTKALDKDTVFNAIIGSGADKVAIDVGQHAHVTNGIHNFGIIEGQVKLGDADLTLYGLVEDNASQLKGESAATNHIMTQAEFETTEFEQRAGIVDADNGITNAYAGSSIVMTGTHLLKAATSPTWEADEIIISSEGVVNVQKDAAFDVTAATDIYNRGLSGTFKNEGILNIAANQGANITGTYAQTGKLYINVKSDVFTPQADEAYAKDGSAQGQLNVTGEANFGSSEIKIVFDEGRTDAELLEIAQHADETRISDVIVASVGINGIGGARTAEEASEADTLTGLNITTNRSSIGMRTMQGSANGHVDLAFYYVPPTPASTGSSATGGSTGVQTGVSRDFSEMISSRLEEIQSPLTPTGTVGGRVGNTYVGVGSAVGAGNPPGAAAGTSATLSENGDAMSYSELSVNDSERDAAIEGLALGTIGSVGAGVGSQASAWVKPFVGWSKQDGKKSSGDANALEKDAHIAKAGDSGDVNTGYSASTYGLAAGVDKMYKGWRIGTAIAATNSNLDGESNSNYTDEMKGIQITEYASKKLESGYVNLQVGLGYMKHDAERTTTDAAAERVTSEFDGYVFQAKVGYEKPLEGVKNDKLTVLAYGDADYIHVANKAYEEEGSLAAFKVDDIDTDALIFGGGLKANYAVGTKSAIYGHAGVGYDVIGDKVETDVTPVFGGDSVRVNGETPEQFEYNLGLGYETTLDSGLNIRAGIDHKGRDGYQSDTASVRFTLPF